MPIKFPLTPQIKSIKIYTDINIYMCLKDKSTNYQTIFRHCLSVKKKARMNSSFTAEYFTSLQNLKIFYSLTKENIILFICPHSHTARFSKFMDMVGNCQPNQCGQTSSIMSNAECVWHLKISTTDFYV